VEIEANFKHAAPRLRGLKRSTRKQAGTNTLRFGNPRHFARPWNNLRRTSTIIKVKQNQKIKHGLTLVLVVIAVAVAIRLTLRETMVPLYCSSLGDRDYAAVVGLLDQKQIAYGSSSDTTRLSVVEEEKHFVQALLIEHGLPHSEGKGDGKNPPRVANKSVAEWEAESQKARETSLSTTLTHVDEVSEALVKAAIPIGCFHGDDGPRKASARVFLRTRPLSKSTLIAMANTIALEIPEVSSEDVIIIDTSGQKLYPF
jgi:flagellar biosynthesis/type III secretory pathway M-ring protein FliF/YscJ